MINPRHRKLLGSKYSTISRLFALVFVTPLTVSIIEAQSSAPVRVGEDGIRRSASKTVMPTYPEVSIRKHSQGVAVVELQYDGTGNVTDVRVLEAPDSEIAQTVRSAVHQWKFRPSTIHGQPLNVKGKLTFYYVIESDGQGHVRNPKQFR